MPILFQPGSIVHGDFFFNREALVKELREGLSSIRQGARHDYALLGLRRTGKSSILYKVKDDLLREAPDVIVVYIDCEEIVETPEAFVKGYIEKIFDAYLERTELLRKVRLRLGRAAREGVSALASLLSHVREVGVKTLEEAVSLYVKLEERKERVKDMREQLVKCIDLPENLAIETKSHLVVMLDEFQYLQRLRWFPSIKNIFEVFRSRMQEQRRTAYIISGSSISMMEMLLTRSNSPFFGQFIIKWVQEMPKYSAIEMVMDLGKKSGFDFDVNAVNKMINFVGTHPYYLQALGYECCVNALEKGETKIRPEIIEEAFKKCVLSPGGTLYDYLRYVYDLSLEMAKGGVLLKSVLKAMGTKEVQTPTGISKEVGRTTPVIQKCLERLIEVDLVRKEKNKYLIRDPLLAVWLKSRS